MSYYYLEKLLDYDSSIKLYLTLERVNLDMPKKLGDTVNTLEIRFHANRSSLILSYISVTDSRNSPSQSKNENCFHTKSLIPNANR